MKAVFLDIDGVLLPFGGDKPYDSEHFCETALQALSDILAACPEAELVLSSTWRCGGGDICAIAEFAAFASKHPGSPLGGVKEFKYTTSLAQYDHRQ